MNAQTEQTELQSWLRAKRGRGVWLAKRLDTNPGYVRQLAARWRGAVPSPEMAARIEIETDGAVRAESMRPGANYVRRRGRIIACELPARVASDG